jgi:hypothetical protein
LSAARTLLAHENASLIGGSYHHPMMDGPITHESENPTTPPTASPTPIRRRREVGGLVKSSAMPAWYV